MGFYQLADLKLGNPSKCGHTVYLDAEYQDPNAELGAKKVIVKKNKHGKTEFSHLERGFSQLVSLFLGKNLTSKQHLVLGPKKVFGLATEHLCYAIEQKEGLEKNFYTLDSVKNKTYLPQGVQQAEEIPYYFLNKLPHGFFKTLLKAEQENKLSIDYSSLASILATSYTLEEDDLHKGNFGFYLIEVEGKPQAVFFKIDHDLMFVDSLMAHRERRPFHWFAGVHAFDIRAEDLLNLPHLLHSPNSYWPTRFSLGKPGEPKSYFYFSEIAAFRSLKKNPKFQHAKWLSFYKHILVPPDLIQLSLEEALILNPDSAQERARVSLIVQATLARQARLRAVLFSIPEFRNFISHLTEQEQEALDTEIKESYEDQNAAASVSETIVNDQALCQSGAFFDEKDTPLHLAIRLGDYRYEESLRMFDSFINVKNAAGQTPLDLALELWSNHPEEVLDTRKNKLLIMQHLLANGAKQSPHFKASQLKAKIEAYRFPYPQLEAAAELRSYQELKTLLRDVGEDPSLGLKSRKKLATACIEQFIQSNQNNLSLPGILRQLKKELNRKGSKEECAPLLYLSQLRSRLWIIRQIRGLYGLSSTRREINQLIDKNLKKHQSKNVFFTESKTAPDLDLDLSTSIRPGRSPTK